MCLEKYLNRLKGDFTYVLINIEIEGMMQKKKLCTCITLFIVHFFTILARLRRENA